MGVCQKRMLLWSFLLFWVFLYSFSRSNTFFFFSPIHLSLSLSLILSHFFFLLLSFFLSITTIKMAVDSDNIFAGYEKAWYIELFVHGGWAATGGQRGAGVVADDGKVLVGIDKHNLSCRRDGSGILVATITPYGTAVEVPLEDGYVTVYKDAHIRVSRINFKSV
jgi:hypothetical protein